MTKVFESQVAEGNIVDDKNAIVGIQRKPFSNKEPEHVFIVLEYVNTFGVHSISRYEYVNEANTNNGLILIKNYLVPENEEDYYKDEILKEDEGSGTAWVISRKDALQLHTNILASQLNTTELKKYNVLGDAASIPKSGDKLRNTSPNSTEKTSEGIEYIAERISGKVPTFLHGALSPSAESCYTWARQMLFSINDPNIIKEFPITLLDFVASIPHRHVPIKQKHKPEIKGCTIM